MNWRFAIDVGGTFTDVVARSPGGERVTFKLLSTGAIRGTGGIAGGRAVLRDEARGEPQGFWTGYSIFVKARGSGGRQRRPGRVAASRPGEVVLDAAIPDEFGEALDYELTCGLEAPVVAIRRLMGLRLDEPIGPIEVRLGTTRATNALLERKGARVALVTTRGFGDVLNIGYQDRPDLFKLNIRKRDELAECAIEIDERLAADGRPLRTPDERAIREQLEGARRRGIEALAICFLHSHKNAAHEELVARIAESVGFGQVSVSSRLSRLERIVPRGDTTVIDAYLSGVIRSYVNSLRRAMPQARIQLMTSNGGLIDASTATGKDTILSGPAGGVVGCAHVSRAAGFARAIGFDMGGTSTDVCRIEPPPIPFEYQHETVKAGVRIQTPVLAIETVAAGGGSVCSFDGQKLTVGPDSAGADPGPACYGCGGPLTITDVNLYLGRLVPEHFPFTLDEVAVERRLSELVEEVNAAAGSGVESRLAARDVAEGFVRIANANMAAAIRRISIARGYDPAEYILTTFGGAGGQHACAIARLLGIRRILCSPFAGVLSAFGIAAAALRRIAQQSVLICCDQPVQRSGDREQEAHWVGHLEACFADITESLRRDLEADGVLRQQLSAPLRTVDACYTGQSTLLTVSADPYDRIRPAFEEMHNQVYGYRHADRPIEIRVARVELAARESQEEREAPGDRQEASKRHDAGPSQLPGGLNPRLSYFRARNHQSWEPHNCVFTRATLPLSGISGPAIIAEPTSTIYVEPGWAAAALDTGDIVLTETQAASQREQISTKCDPIQLELFNNQFAAVAEQMGETLRRTALSTNVKERLDFSCAVFTPAGDLVVNAPHIPVHLGGMSDCVKCLLEDVGSFSPGDVYLTNDPFRGGSHLNDLTVITPVHDERGERTLFLVASRAHHAEIGGKRPGSMPPDSTCLAEEGVLIRAFPCVQNGRLRLAELRALLTCQTDRELGDAGSNITEMPGCQPVRSIGDTAASVVPKTSSYPSRSPDENIADVSAQIAANQRGVQALLAMVARYGIEVVHAYMGHIQWAAEQRARAAIRKLPRGTSQFTDYLDDGAPICLAVTVQGDKAVFDFTGTGPVLPGNLNANRAIVTSAVLYCLRCLIDEDIPLNGGVLAPVRIVLPRCFLNPPADADPWRCPAVAAGNVETSQRVVDAIFGALQSVAASQGTMNNLLIGNERFGYYETICGGAGAGPGFHGADAVHTHMTNTRLTDPEVLESRYPLRLVRFGIREREGIERSKAKATKGDPETAALPKQQIHGWEGGHGVIREIEFLAPLEVSVISQRRTRPPYGVHGGPPGQIGRNLLVRQAKTELPVGLVRERDEGTPKPRDEPAATIDQGSTIDNASLLPGICSFSAQPGDRLIIETPGGGSWGVGMAPTQL